MKSKIIIGTVAIIAALGLVLALAKTRTENGTMLNFVGRSYKEAEFFANQYSLDFNVTWEESDKYSTGTVISQSIPKGTVVNIGDKLDVVVAN